MKNIAVLLKWRTRYLQQSKCLLLLIVVVLLSLRVQSQHVKMRYENTGNTQNVGKLSERKFSLCTGLSVPRMERAPLLTNIMNLEREASFNEEVERIKREKTREKVENSQLYSNEDNRKSISLSDYAMGTNFQGNIFNGGAPPDNTIAIGDNGIIVSVINCNVAYFNENGSQLWTGSFWELFDDPTLTELIYDPIVIYDSQVNRFVMIAIHGFSSETTRLIISFSKTDNPLDGWWIYQLTGNPLNNSCWLDYPKLGISTSEVFVTGNLFNDFTGFTESVIYQIGKNEGYSGATLNWSLWSDISGSPITLIPVNYGQQGNYGPGLYFVNQSPASGNELELYELTDSLGGNPQLTRNTIIKQAYGLSGNALQLGSSVELITGDCRIQNAFYLDGIIHYVFQSDYFNTNFTGINYNRINLATLTNSSYAFGEVGFDSAYPSVASFATSPEDLTVAFCYLRSGASISPETRVVFFNSDQTWSNSILVKAGSNYVDAFQFDNIVRWGDYTGIAFKNNPSTPEVWVSGCFGSTQTLFNTDYNCFNTWIAQITDLSVGVAEFNSDEDKGMSLYPNPIIDLFNVDFNVGKTGAVVIEVFDLTGKKVISLFNGNLQKGENILTFNRSALAKGSYVLTITMTEGEVITRKFIVE